MIVNMANIYNAKQICPDSGNLGVLILSDVFRILIYSDVRTFSLNLVVNCQYAWSLVNKTFSIELVAPKTC
jgi:hypothetical protein